MNLTFRLLPLYQFILHHPTTLLLIILQLPSYSTKNQCLLFVFKMYTFQVKSYDMSVGPYQSLQIGVSQHRQIGRNDGYRKTSGSLVLPDYSRRLPGNRRRFSNYCDPCTDYLNNPMFESLQPRRYWNSDKSITLRPFNNKKHSYKAINVKSACKVL